MFWTTKWSSSGRFLHAVLWYFSCIRISRLVDVRICTHPDINQALRTYRRHENYVISTNKKHIFSLMIQFIYIVFDRFCTTKWSSSGSFVRAVLWYFFTRPYKPSGWCQDMYTSWHQPDGLYGRMKKYHNTARTRLPEDVQNLSKTI